VSEIGHRESKRVYEKCASTQTLSMTSYASFIMQCLHALSVNARFLIEEMFSLLFLTVKPSWLRPPQTVERKEIS